jgi:hypothetical protein
MTAMDGRVGAFMRRLQIRWQPALCRFDRIRNVPMNRDHAADAFARLLHHLRERSDVQNIELMTLAGFCRNCLADWYREAAEAAGEPMSREQAREIVYGEPFADWKARHQREATPEQLAAFEAARRRHSPGG